MTTAFLQRGDRGESVSALQNLLVSHGFKLSVDGDFGPGTERTLKKFQELSGILPTGQTDEDTWNALYKVYPPPPTKNPETPLEGRIYFVLTECGCSPRNAAIWTPHLARASEEAKIFHKNDLSAFLATIVHESSRLSGSLVESLNYSAQALMRNWPSRFPYELADRFGRTVNHPADQKMIAIIAYGGRMGNAPNPSTDGWDFRGRGPIQITGRWNYEAFSKYANVDAVSDPELILVPKVGARSAAWFWRENKCSAPAIQGDWKSVRRIVNGGTFGLEECIKYTEIGLKHL